MNRTIISEQSGLEIDINTGIGLNKDTVKHLKNKYPKQSMKQIMKQKKVEAVVNALNSNTTISSTVYDLTDNDFHNMVHNIKPQMDVVMKHFLR